MFQMFRCLEGKFAGKKERGKPRKTWIDDLLRLTPKNIYHKIKRLKEENGT